MPFNPDADIEITTFKWVPEFARGFVRDLRVRWALEEIGLDYSLRLIDGGDKPEEYYRDQPFGQVPVYREGGLTLFESGAILAHIGEKDERLLPRDERGRARAIQWLIAALNSLEPTSMQLVVIDVFNPDAEWAKQRRPEAVAQLEERLKRLSDWLGDKQWFEDRFTIGDMMMVDALRGVPDEDLLARHANLADYVARGTDRPAFQRAMADQIALYEEADQPA